jgi:hypothetical protein
MRANLLGGFIPRDKSQDGEIHIILGLSSWRWDNWRIAGASSQRNIVSLSVFDAFAT